MTISKKGIFICCILSVTAAVFLFINACTQQNKSEVFSDGRQTIHLSADGSFTALLAHNNRITGTYTKKTDDNRIVVSFTADGKTTTGIIADNALQFPEEWEDGHHHGNILPKM